MSNESETPLAQTAGEIADILSARTRATQEGRILSLIRLYKDQALVDLLDLLELDRLLNALDNRLWGPDSRKEFIRLLDPVIEQIFTWPGMGRLFFESIRERDYPTIMGLTLMFSVLTLAGQLLADVLYAVVDPRVRLEDK